MAITNHRQRRGFVLPMTLLVIALTAIVLVGVARQSLQLATKAAKAHQNLQRKWGSISCQRTLLEESDAWLSLPLDQLPGSIGDAGHRRIVFSLGDLDFDVLLADENAKINLNAMKRELPLPVVAQMLTGLAQSTKPLRVRLRPHSFASAALVGEDKKRDLARLDSWGQVFPMQQFSDPADAPRRIAAATVDLTCWGNGKLNVFRASETALETLCAQFASKTAARQLISLRNRAEIRTEDELYAALDLDPRELARLGTHMTNRSSTYSMWLNVSAPHSPPNNASGRPHRGWYEFYVVTEKERPSTPTTAENENQNENRPLDAGEIEMRERRRRPMQQARFTW